MRYFTLTLKLVSYILARIVPRTSLLTIHKVFVRPHLDYADIIYVKLDNESFNGLVEKVQYNAALTITGAIRGTSLERIYNELDLESLADRRWYRKMTFFYKIVMNLASKYVKSYLLP